MREIKYREHDEADPKYTKVYALMDWGWTREDCIAAIQQEGLPLPGKSSCFFLPQHEKAGDPYDRDIPSDSGMMDLYAELARETRWRRFGHTEIERIRLNALRQMRQEGRPSYDGEFISYRQGQTCVHCGNIRLPELLLYLACHERAEQFVLFTYPYWTEDQTAKYYRFDLSETAVTGAGIYRESVWNQMLKASEASGIVFRTLPHLEDDPPIS